MKLFVSCVNVNCDRFLPETEQRVKRNHSAPILEKKKLCRGGAAAVKLKREGQFGLCDPKIYMHLNRPNVELA